MRQGLTAAVKKIWEVTEVDLEPGIPFTFLGIELDRRANMDLKIHQSTTTKQLLTNYGVRHDDAKLHEHTSRPTYRR